MDIPNHYVNNGKICPFENLGCKFSHINSKMCRNGQLCEQRLCPFRHSEEVSSGKNVMEPNDDATKSNMEDKDISDDSVNFVTSTQVKRKVNCEECENQS